MYWRKTSVTDAVKQKLQKELDELDTELRVELPKQIKTAKEWGDLRENAEYHAALARQQFVQARIRDLRQRLSEVSSIDLSKIPHGKAAYGSTVVLYDPERDEEVTYRLVTPEESDPNAGAISTTSPIGDRKSTRLNSSHANISYAVFCLKKKKIIRHRE